MTGPQPLDLPDATDWWFEQVEWEFAFLLSAEFDFKVSERFRHFEGNYIVYDNPTARVTLECAPTWNSLAGWIWIGPLERRVGGLVWDVLSKLEPGQDWKYHGSKTALDKSQCSASMKLWADGLRRFLPGLMERGSR